jgi:hypothetical protein
MCQLIRAKRLQASPHIHRPEGNCKQHANGKYQCITEDPQGTARWNVLMALKQKQTNSVPQARYYCGLNWHPIHPHVCYFVLLFHQLLSQPFDTITSRGLPNLQSANYTACSTCRLANLQPANYTACSSFRLANLQSANYTACSSCGLANLQSANYRTCSTYLYIWLHFRNEFMTYRYKKRSQGYR